MGEKCNGNRRRDDGLSRLQSWCEESFAVVVERWKCTDYGIPRRVDIGGTRMRQGELV